MVVLYKLMYEAFGNNRFAEKIEGEILADQELYRKGNSKEEFRVILEKNMRPVYDSARRQGYEIWNLV